MLKLRDIMTRDVATVTPDMTVRDAMGVLTSRHVSGAPVVAGTRVVGVVTTTDLLALVATVPHAPSAEDRAAPADEDTGPGERPGDAESGIPEPPAGRDAFYTELWTQPPSEAPSDTPASWREWSTLDEHTVREAMNDAVISLPPDALVTDAAERMRAAAIHRVLVLEAGRLEGIVSVLDIADAVSERRIASREYVFHTVPRARHTHGGGLLGAIGRHGRHMEGEGTLTLGDVMSHDVVSVSPELAIRDVIRLLAAKRVGGVPVISGRTVVGVVSAADIVAFAASLAGVPTERPTDEGPGQDDEDWPPVGEWRDGDEPAAAYYSELWADADAAVDDRFADAASPEWDALGDHIVSEVMTRRLVSLAPSASVVAAADYMRQARIHRVLVMRHGELLGVVSASDIARAVAERRSIERRRLFDDEAAFDARGWQLGGATPTTMPASEAGAANEESHADRH